MNIFNLFRPNPKYNRTKEELELLDAIENTNPMLLYCEALVYEITKQYNREQKENKLIDLKIKLLEKQLNLNN